LAVAVFAAPVLSAATASAEGERYVLVSHAPDSDSWWNTIKNGIALAGQQMGVEVEYRNPPTGDLADMARIIEQAAASSPTASSPPWPITTCCPARSRPRSIPASTSSS
jgi:simple sugar transport system substrate-binding protein